MSKPDYAAQLAAWQTCVAALREIDADAQARTIASIVVMFDLADPVAQKLRTAERFITSTRTP